MGDFCGPAFGRGEEKESGDESPHSKGAFTSIFLDLAVC